MKALLKWVGAAFGLVVLAAAGSLAVLYAVAAVKTHKSWRVPADPIAADVARADAKRGERLTRVRMACVECHADDLGGKMYIEDPALGKLYGSNLTPAALKDWTDDEIGRAIRHGVDRAGRPLLLMPSQDYQHLTRRDLADIVAYLRSVPAAARPTRPSSLGPVMTVLVALGKAPTMTPAAVVDHAAPFAEPVPETVTPEFGHYIARTLCMGCHGQGLTGGPIPGGDPHWPPAAGLTPDALGGWSEADFIKTMRTGKNPSAATLRAPMVVKYTAQFSDDELKALWAYLKTVKPAITEF